RFHENLGPGAALLEKMFSRFMEGRAPTEFTLKEKTEFIVQGVLSGKIFELVKPANVSLWNELSGYFARPEVKAKLAAHLDKVSEPERRTFLWRIWSPDSWRFASSKSSFSKSAAATWSKACRLS